MKKQIDITCDYCVFDGENFIDVMRFLKTNEVKMRLSQDREKVLVVGDTEMRRGDVIVNIPEIGSVGSRLSFLTAGKYTQLLNDQLERVLSDPDLKDNPAVVLLQKQVASLEERIGDLEDERFRLINGYSPNEKLPDDMQPVIVQLRTTNTRIMATRDDLSKNWISSGNNTVIEKERIIRWWKVQKW